MGNCNPFISSNHFLNLIKKKLLVVRQWMRMYQCFKITLGWFMTTRISLVNFRQVESIGAWSVVSYRWCTLGWDWVRFSVIIFTLSNFAAILWISDLIEEKGQDNNLNGDIPAFVRCLDTSVVSDLWSEHNHLATQSPNPLET